MFGWVQIVSVYKEVISSIELLTSLNHICQNRIIYIAINCGIILTEK